MPAVAGARPGPSTGGGTVLAAASGRIVHVSRRARSILEGSIDGLVPATLVDLCAEHDRSRLVAWLEDESSTEPLDVDLVSASGRANRCTVRRMGGVAGEACVVAEVTEPAAGPTLIDTAAQSSRFLERLHETNRNLSSPSPTQGLGSSTAAMVASVEDLLDQPPPPRRRVDAETLLRLGRLSEQVEAFVAACRSEVRTASGVGPGELGGSSGP